MQAVVRALRGKGGRRPRCFHRMIRRGGEGYRTSRGAGARKMFYILSGRTQPHSKPWVPLGYVTSEEATFKSRTPKRKPAQGAELGEAVLPLQQRTVPRQRVQGEGQKDWPAGQMDKSRLKSEGKKKSKSAGHISENNNGDDRDNQAQKGALESFTISVDEGLAGVPTREATREKDANY
ncbi:unnamed protein product [Scytosiphon promiscuus]